MSGKIYLGDYGVIVEVSTGIDLTLATSYELSITKANGRKVSWSPTPVVPLTGGLISYTTISGDLDVAGDYKLQAKVRFVSGYFIGETAVFHVYNLWE